MEQTYSSYGRPLKLKYVYKNCAFAPTGNFFSPFKLEGDLSNISVDFRNKYLITVMKKKWTTSCHSKI